MKYGKRGTEVKSGADRSCEEQQAFALGYVYHSTQETINAVADAAGGKISVSILAAELGRLLIDSASREVLYGSERLPEMRGSTAEVDEELEPASAVHVRPHDERPSGPGIKPKRMSAAARKRIAAAQRARWAKWKKKKTLSPKALATLRKTAAYARSVLAAKRAAPARKAA